MTSTLIPIIVAGAMGGWAFLSLIGGERCRRANELQVEADLAAKAGPANAEQSAAIQPASSAPAKPAKPTSGKPANLSPTVASGGKAKSDAKPKAAAAKK